MRDFFETVRHRHSIRKYQQNRAIEAEKLHAILEMASAAPSAGDLQAYRIVVVRDGALRAELARACDGQSFLSEAPVCLAFCSDPHRSERQFGERGRELYALQDATIAAAYAQLAVVAAGLGSTWIGAFDQTVVDRLLELPNGVRTVALLSIGYPAELPQPSHRRHLDDVVSWR